MKQDPQNAVIIIPALSRLNAGALNIHLEHFRGYIAITLINIFSYRSSGLHTQTSGSEPPASLAGLELSQLWIVEELDVAKTAKICFDVKQYKETTLSIGRHLLCWMGT